MDTIGDSEPDEMPQGQNPIEQAVHTIAAQHGSMAPSNDGSSMAMEAEKRANMQKMLQALGAGQNHGSSY